MGDDDFIKSMSFVMNAAIGSTYYRLLGLSMLPIPLEHVERYIRLSEEGMTGYGGKLVELKPLGVRPEIIMRGVSWKNCDVSKGFNLTFDLYVGGLAMKRRPGTLQNTVFARKYWWKLYLVRSLSEGLLRVPPGTLRLR